MHNNEAARLWQSLSEYLQARLSVDDSGSITLEISNEAPSGPDSPRVVFDRLALEVHGAEIEQQPATRGLLAPGESRVFILSSADPSSVYVNVSADVSQGDFFRIARVCEPPVDVVRPVVEDWLRSFASALGSAEALRTRLRAVTPGTNVTALATLSADMTEWLDHNRRTRECSVPAVRASTEPLFQHLKSLTRLMRSAAGQINAGDANGLRRSVADVAALELDRSQAHKVLSEVLHTYGLES